MIHSKDGLLKVAVELRREGYTFKEVSEKLGVSISFLTRNMPKTPRGKKEQRDGDALSAHYTQMKARREAVSILVKQNYEEFVSILREVQAKYGLAPARLSSNSPGFFDRIRLMYKMKEEGKSTADIARALSCSETTIYNYFRLYPKPPVAEGEVND